jgi:hypothetical protein
MTRTPCQSAALDRILAVRAARIALCFRTVVKIILMIAAIVRATLQEPGTCCRKAGQRLLALRAGPFCTMMLKLTTLRSMPMSRRRRTSVVRDNRGTALAISLSARVHKVASLIAAMLPDRCRKEQPTRANGHDTRWESSPSSIV